ncbi:membrane protein [Bartonella birtlesii]|uniref:membrane protein n=1 Tax=Bartonella birtlesii TaxID=111504 RepID=UPI0003630CAA|nr:membrane protein [Bartonella birtlesii]
MNLKRNKGLLTHTVSQNVLVVLLLAVLCASLIWLYYFMQPRGYRATLTFSLSDSVGRPLPIEKQNSVVAFLLSRPIFLDNSDLQHLSSSASYKKGFLENIHLSRHGDLISLTFEAETPDAAQDGVEIFFAAFSQAILQQKQKLLLTEQQENQQYDDAALLNIVKGLRSSFDYFIQQNVKQTELHDLSIQLMEATLKRIHLTSLNSTINMMRERGQSLLSLSFIANNVSVAALEAQRNLLETQRAHMVAQLGWTHPQIKAMSAELEVLSQQLENKILQTVQQFHSDEVIATEFEEQLKKRMSIFVEGQSQSLKQMFNELENKIKAVINAQRKEMDKDFLFCKIQKIHMVVPTTLVPISFVTFHGKNIIVSAFVSLIIFLIGGLLFRQCSKTKIDHLRSRDFKSEENNLKDHESVFVSQKVKSLETFVTIEALSNFLKNSTSTVISIIGPESARTAAKLSLHLIKECKTILLVDISGQQIEKVIGPHRGLSDILMGNAQLQDVIYHDYDTGVDILPQGLTSAVSAQDFSNDILRLLQEFKKDYDFIILEMESEPKYGFEQFAELTDCYISSIAVSAQDWIQQMVRKFPKTIYRVIAL